MLTTGIKKAIKNLAGQILPDQLFTKIISIRSRNFQYNFLKKHGLIDITKKLIERYGVNVIHGPFAGMKYPRKSLISRHGTPKLLGSYEQELHPVIMKVIANAQQYEFFIDIGCAEGYYAVGLALKTGKKVYAFDTEPRELGFCFEMAKLNQVDTKVILQNWCDSEYLQGLNNKRCFIVSDCEGCEAKLFEDETIKCLKNCDLLIELHDINEIKMSELIGKRFKDSHDIKLISAESRKAEQYEELTFLGESASTALSEYRLSNQKWMYLEAKKAVV